MLADVLSFVACGVLMFGTLGAISWVEHNFFHLHRFLFPSDSNS